jgi:hypothetical protein
MKSFLPLLILVMISLTFRSAPSFAGEEKPAAEKAEPKAEGKEGEKKEGVSEADSMPWLAIEAKIQELAAKIESKKESINKMLEEKEKLKDNSSELKDKIKDIIAEHKALEKMADEYSSQINLLKYRYPERHAKRDRKYDRVDVKSIEDMEQALGIDGKLNRNMSRMRTAYDAQPPTKDKIKSTPQEKAAPKSKKGETIEEQLPIIMQK